MYVIVCLQSDKYTLVKLQDADDELVHNFGNGVFSNIIVVFFVRVKLCYHLYDALAVSLVLLMSYLKQVKRILNT